ncbi:hypothetical protein Hdeb2414_s0018g00516921 [Helianthus debilis subsp. tardiflorus]
MWIDLFDVGISRCSSLSSDVRCGGWVCLMCEWVAETHRLFQGTSFLSFDRRSTVMKTFPLGEWNYALFHAQPNDFEQNVLGNYANTRLAPNSTLRPPEVLLCRLEGGVVATANEWHAATGMRNRNCLKRQDVHAVYSNI